MFEDDEEGKHESFCTCFFCEEERKRLNVARDKKLEEEKQAEEPVPVNAHHDRLCQCLPCTRDRILMIQEEIKRRKEAKGQVFPKKFIKIDRAGVTRRLEEAQKKMEPFVNKNKAGDKLSPPLVNAPGDDLSDDDRSRLRFMQRNRHQCYKHGNKEDYQEWTNNIVEVFGKKYL